VGFRIDAASRQAYVGRCSKEDDMSETKARTLNRHVEERPRDPVGKAEGVLEHAGRAVKEQAGRIRHAVEEKIDALGDKSAREIGNDIRGWVREHPWRTLLIAAGAGAILGRVLRR
jgi:ElaB/YqjD/DUF883 family membrane-anchored ribosome-binding protein